MIPLTRIRKRPARKAPRPSIIEPAPFDDEERFEMLMVLIGRALRNHQKETIFVPYGEGMQIRCTIEFQREGES